MNKAQRGIRRKTRVLEHAARIDRCFAVFDWTSKVSSSSRKSE